MALQCPGFPSGGFCYCSAMGEWFTVIDGVVSMWLHLVTGARVFPSHERSIQRIRRLPTRLFLV